MGYISCDRCDFQVGQRIDGRYIVDKALGEGTFGTVFRVTDGAGGVTYALKILKLWTVEPHEREALLRRFDMEYKTGQIPSDYLVHSRGKGRAKGNPYIVMDYLPGGDLLQAAEHGTIDFAAVGADILYGLRDLHRCGKVHRDLKPENVLLKANGTAALTDFGISGDRNKRMTERGVLGTPKQIFGTYGYMPPEQINPRRGDATVLPTTDIFSFGVMMFQLLTHVMPFGRLERESDLYGYVENAKTGRWERERLRQVTRDENWMRLIEGCLEPDFRRRLQNTDEALKLLPLHRGRNQPSSNASEQSLFNSQGDHFLLRVMQGEEHGRVYKLNALLTGGRCLLTMGRESQDVQNAVSIKEQETSYVSRRHSTIEWDPVGNAWYIRDGQWDRSATGDWRTSLNGTYVNSTEVTPQRLRLRPGDIVSVGDVKLRVETY